MRTKESLLPVGAKAKRETAKSLRTLIKSDRYSDIRYGIKFTAGNIGYSDGIYSFPYFCAFLLKDYLKRVDLEQREVKMESGNRDSARPPVQIFLRKCAGRNERIVVKKKVF